MKKSDDTSESLEQVLPSGSGEARFNPMDYPISFREAQRLTDIPSWHSHIPFAFALVAILRPGTVVELGVHKGDSYCAFCQAVDELGLKTKCYGVDTWEGDDQAGYYDTEVLTELRDYHDPRYGRFSKLIQSTFDEALGYFAENSIDLLHIDGLHLYESVKHDFENWLPKMSHRGVVVLHDTNVRERNFGVWKFWEEIREKYPHLEFTYGEGLGLLAVGRHVEEKLQTLIDMDDENKRLFADFYFSVGSRLAFKGVSKHLEGVSKHLKEENERLLGHLRNSEDSEKRLQGELLKRDAAISGLYDEVGSLNEKVQSRNAQISQLDAAFREIEAELARTYASKSWRLTKPLRAMSRLARAAAHRLGVSGVFWSERFYNLLRRASRIIPISPLFKQRIKGLIVRKIMPFFIRNRRAGDGAGQPGADPLDRAHMLRLPEGEERILVVDERLPTPDQDSGSERMAGILKILRGMGYKVTFFSDKTEIIERYENNLKRLDIPVIYGFAEGVNHLESFGHTYRYVWLSRPDVAYAYLPAVRAYAIHAAVLYDTVDLAGVRFAREADLSGDLGAAEMASYYKKLERLNISCSDFVLAITPKEKDEILRINPECRASVLPNIHGCISNPAPYHGRKNLMFIGGFWHKPNEDAVFYFVKSILPLIQRDLPEIAFYIVGSNMPGQMKLLRSKAVEPVGYVPDASPYFLQSRVFVAPLRFGAGMKGKIGQSMSYGLPVVTTSIGAEGMGLTTGVNVMVADKPEAFAEEVVRLYTQEDLWSRVSFNSMTYIKENLSEASARERIAQIFKITAG